MEIRYREIILRPWEIGYAEDLAKVANNKKIADNLRDGFPNPYTTGNAIEWIKSVIPLNDPPKLFAIFYQGEIAGSIGLVTKDNIYSRNLETGYFVGEKYWGRNIATHSIIAITHYAFSHFEIERLYAETFSDNKASGRALEKAGFKLEATIKRNIYKNGVIKDSCIYSKLREGHEPSGDVLIIF
ncbi:MAG: GNAT family N-acetyltransferase [Bacteroidales bacterium]